MKKFRLCPPARDDIYAQFAREHRFSPYCFMSFEEGETLEEICTRMQDDSESFPPGTAPGIQDVALGLMILIQSGQAEVVDV